MAYIGVQPADAYTSFAVQHFTTSATDTFTLDYPVANENEIALFINNVRQEPGSGYAYTASGTTLTLSSAITGSDSMYAVFIGKAVQTVTPASGSVTNDMLSGSIATSKLANQNIGFRNLIINGDMSIAQRGTSSSGQTSAGYKTCDRFRISIQSLGTWTITQDSDTPSNQGFGYSLKLQCTTADASPASTDDLYIQHKIEGQNLTQLKYGGSGAESLTLSFWVKSNKTGTASLNFLQRDNSAKLYTTTYSISSANTWEKKTITISGDTSGIINNDNGSGFEIFWWLNSGSLFTSGTTRNSWSSYADGDSNVSNLGLGGSTSDNFYITGVQLEVGTSASDFEFLPYDVNLKRCQRYFAKQTGGNATILSSGTFYTTNGWLGHLKYTTTMRNAPSLSTSGAFKIRNASGDSSASSIVLSGDAGLDSLSLQATATGTSGDGGVFRTDPSGGSLSLDAEL